MRKIEKSLEIRKQKDTFHMGFKNSQENPVAKAKNIWCLFLKMNPYL